jgi:ATP-dependent protease ClpP protease subunit
MAYTHTAIAPRDIAISQPTAPRRPGLMRRVLDAMVAARMRQAEREIALFLNSTGGRFTDETEREIERRFLSNGNHF